MGGLISVRIIMGFFFRLRIDGPITEGCGGGLKAAFYGTAINSSCYI